ncbi:DUF4270 family protein [Parapedobacter deserti]|uniref:DUF4270 family protein n=1 Tax=Parapedobacter deserti TaxID=1912957 RepID=A0ABV7JQ28_9SPHI
MNYHTKDLLTLLISLFVLGGCTNPSGIGLDVDPEDQIRGVLTDTLTLQAATFLDDSARSSSFSSSQTMFGRFVDPMIGTTVADLAIAIGRPTTVPRIRPDAEIDSVILVLPYGTEYFGDTLSSTFSLRVRQLDENYTDGASSSKRWSVTNELLGSTTISRFRLSDTISVTKHIDGKDSVVKDIPQLRVALSPEFFKELFSESVDSALLSTVSGFNSHVKGLFLDVDADASSGIGGLVAFRGLANTTGIHLTYRQPNGKEGDDADTDTIRTFLPTTIQSSNVSPGVYGLATQVNRTYNEAVQVQLDNPEGNYETVYLQAPAGLRTRLRIPYIDSLKGRNIAVNKAELVLYVDEVSDEQFNAYAPRLTLYREDIAGRRQPVPDGDSRTSQNNFGQSGFGGDGRSLWYRYGTWRAFGGELDNARKRYVFQLTSYVQDLLLGKINSNEFFIAPAAFLDGQVPYYPVMNTGSRAIIQNVRNSDLRMKLNIYYTQIGD